MKTVLRVVALLMVVLVMGCKGITGNEEEPLVVKETTIKNIGFPSAISASNGKAGVEAGSSIGTGFTFIPATDAYNQVADEHITDLLAAIKQSLPLGVKSLDTTVNTNYWKEDGSVIFTIKTETGYIFEDNTIKKTFIASIETADKAWFGEGRYEPPVANIFEVDILTCSKKTAAAEGQAGLEEPSGDSDFIFTPALDSGTLITFDAILKCVYAFFDKNSKEYLKIFKVDSCSTNEKGEVEMNIYVEAYEGYIIKEKNFPYGIYTFKIAAAEGNTFYFSE